MSEIARAIRSLGYLILFEDLGEDQNQFNMFPRSQSGWISLARKHGMTCIWSRGAMYWSLRSVLAGLVRRRGLKIRSDSGGSALGGSLVVPGISFLRRLVARLDLIVDPYILPLLPSWTWTSGIMVFIKRT